MAGLLLKTTLQMRPAARVLNVARSTMSRPAPRSLTVRAEGGERQIEDIQVGELIEGTVAGIQSYGAFIDIGAATQGLVHISQIRDGFVSNVSDELGRGDEVTVKVLSVDVGRRRVGLSMILDDGGDFDDEW